MAGRARAGYSCYKFACVQCSVDLHDIVLIWPVRMRRSPTELRVQPSPDGSDSIASSVDFDTTVFFFCCFRKKLRARVTRNKENNNSGLTARFSIYQEM